MKKVHTSVKLGKLAARHDPRTLSLSKYLKGAALPPPPPSVAYTGKVSSWPPMGNLQIGDCTCAAAGHMIEEWTAYSAPTIFIPTDDQIISAYSAVSGYDPATQQNDNGASALDVLNYWRQTGIAGHQIDSYVGLEPKNHVAIQDSVYLFGNVYLGLAMPLSAQDQDEWAVPPNGAVGVGAPGSWGGHAVPIVGYDPRGLTVVTWGALKRMSWSFLDTYADEAYAVLSSDWIDATNHLTPSNFDFQTLRNDLSLLQGTQLAA